MSSTGGQGGTTSCSRCGVVIDGCAFCERQECRELLCYRCVRITLGQEIAQPHRHGG
jgi:hypothetical protein